jgi:hypothetical protein
MATEPAWRSRAVTALIVAATVLLLAECLTIWVHRQALDTPYVERASRQMLEDPKVRSAVAGYLVDELYLHVAVDRQIDALLPPRARGFAAPLNAALRGFAPRAAEEILGEPFVVDTWATAVGRAHREFLRLVNGDPNRAADVYLGLRPLLLELAERLGLERQAAAALPADAGRVELFRGNRIGKLREAIRLVNSMSIYGLLLVAALYGVALALARGRRRQALLHMGLAVTATGVVLILVRSLAGTVLVQSVVGSSATLEPAGHQVWRILSDPLASIGWMAVTTGLAAIVLALLAGPSAVATGIRKVLRPALVDRPAWAWAGVGVAIVVVLTTIPAIDATRVISRSVLIAVIVGGTEMVRRVALAERSDGAAVRPSPPVAASS